jgi:hypothetical protein
MAFERAGEAGLAARLFGRDSPHALDLWRAAWPKVVGPDLARRTELVAVEGVTLRVRVPDARWRRVLHRLQPDILARLRQVAGPLAPRRLGFVEGGISDAPPPGTTTEERMPPVAACPPAVAQEAEAIADPEVRARFIESARHYLARAKGRAHR